MSPNYLFRRSSAGAAISVFRGRARRRDIQALFEDLDAHIARRAHPIVVITVIENEATLGDRGRAYLAERMRSANDGIRAWSVIIERRGFWGTISRTIAATVRLMSKSAYPFKVSPSVPEGVAFLQTHSSVELAALAAEVEGARRALASAGAAATAAV